MSSTHFTSGDYLTIRTESGQYSVKIEGSASQSVGLSIYEIDAEIFRLQRRKKAYAAFLNGETVLCPSALQL